MTTATAVASTSDRVLAGVLLTSVGYGLFSVQDAAVKLMVVGFSVWQILFFRSVTILAGCIVIGRPGIVAEAARSPAVLPMLLRSFLMLTAWLCYYSAARDLQLAELTTIYFAAPVIVTVLSVFILKEEVPAIRWFAVVLGFVGVFIACDPVSLGLSVAMVKVLAAASLWALAMVLLRKIAMGERTIVQLVLNNGFFLVIAGVPMLFFWVAPDPWHLAMLIGTGVLGGVAQFALFEGVKRAPASVIAPFEYTSLVWAFGLGWLIWADVPRPEVFYGAALIVGAGLIIIVAERFRRPAR